MKKVYLHPFWEASSPSCNLPVQFEHPNQVEALLNPTFTSVLGNGLVFIPLSAQIAIEPASKFDNVTCAGLAVTTIHDMDSSSCNTVGSTATNVP